MSEHKQGKRNVKRYCFRKKDKMCMVTILGVSKLLGDRKGSKMSFTNSLSKS